jgi:hypothetical protein
MSSRFFLVLVILIISFSPRYAYSLAGYNWQGKTGSAWDLVIETGLQRLKVPRQAETGFVSVYGGRLLVNDPHFFSYGMSLESLADSLNSISLRGQYMHLITGFWLQALLPWQEGGKHGLGLTLGWSVVGVEYRKIYSPSDTQEESVFLKLHVPIGTYCYFHCSK